MERESRSNAYQWYIKEIPWDNDALCTFSNQDGLYLDQCSAEKLMDLKEELMQYVWLIASKHLTDHQFKVMSLTCQGLTQDEIARELNVNQSSINKVITGARQKCKNGNKKYGGLIHKLQKILKTDQEAQKILFQINELVYQ